MGFQLFRGAKTKKEKVVSEGSIWVYEGACFITFSMHDIDFPFLGLKHFEARLHVGKSLFCRPFLSLSLR